MNIFLTGANGFIGNHIVKALEQKYTVYRLEHGDKYNYHNNNMVANLLDDEHIESICNEKLEIDIIIHTASRMAYSFNVNDISVLTDNIFMYNNLIRIINKFKPSKVINFSSIAVYPNMDGEYYEDSEIRPSINNDGLYGLSKFCGENILDLMCKETDIINLRISQVYGNGMKKDRIFSIMKKELEETNIISVFGNGRRISGFIEVNTLVDKVMLFMHNKITGIFNISAENLSYRDLASRIISQFGDKKSSIRISDQGISSQCYINIDKLKKVEVDYEL